MLIFVGGLFGDKFHFTKEYLIALELLQPSGDEYPPAVTNISANKDL